MIRYLIKLKSLQILPLDIKLLYTDLILFHRIIHRNICIDLPEYIQLASPPRSLRTSHIDPLYFDSSIKPRLTTLSENKCSKTSKVKCRNQDSDPNYGQNCLQEFEHSYFYRTHLQWNKLPLDLRVIEQYQSFQIELNKYLWNNLMEQLNVNLVYDD